MGSIRCIAIDLDRTALDSCGRLPERNRKALLCAIELGVKVVIASGRPFTALPDDVLSIPGISYAITGNGCAVYDPANGRRLKGYTIDPGAVISILDICRLLPVKLECFIDGQGYIDSEYYNDPVRFGTPVYGVEYIRSTRLPVDDIYSFISDNSGKIDALDVIAFDAVGKKYAEELISGNVPGLYLTSSADQLLEISSFQCGKWSGLRYILECERISPDETAAFGDNDNDVDMLSNVAASFAMAGSSPACLAAASRVTLSNDDCGVAVEIEKLLELLN